MRNTDLYSNATVVPHKMGPRKNLFYWFALNVLFFNASAGAAAGGRLSLGCLFVLCVTSQEHLEEMSFKLAHVHLV